MKAFLFERNGEPQDVLRVVELPTPSAAPGEILVRVLFSPVHPSDLHIMRGRFGRQPRLPASPGVECVGVVEALGPGVGGPAPGTRVVLRQAFGCWREFVVARAEMVIPVPDEVSDEDAAQALINPVTAWAMTMAEHQMEPGDWIVQTAAGSTVGRLVLQLARSEGFKTINIVRRRAQVPEIRALGADVVLTSEDDNWGSELMRAADGKAPAKAIDCVSGRTGATVVRHLAPGGKLLLFGALSSHRQTDSAAFEMPIFGPRLIYGATTVQGWFLFHWLDNTPVEECRRVLSTILDRLACRELRLPPAKQHLPEKIADALLDADGTGRGGKPLLRLQAFGSG